MDRHCSAYVFGWDVGLTRYVHTFMMHPSKEARCLRRDAIVGYQVSLNRLEARRCTEAMDVLRNAINLQTVRDFLRWKLCEELSNCINESLWLDACLERLMCYMVWTQSAEGRERVLSWVEEQLPHDRGELRHRMHIDAYRFVDRAPIPFHRLLYYNRNLTKETCRILRGDSDLVTFLR